LRRAGGGHLPARRRRRSGPGPAAGHELPKQFANLFSLEVLGTDGAPDATMQFFAVQHEGLQSSTAAHGVYLKLGFGDHAQVPMLIRMPT
jgi:hypothetical protein